VTRRSWLSHRAAASVFIIWAALVTGSEAVEFEITTAEVSVVSDFHTVNAKAQFTFSEEALEALANGVNLTIKVEVELKRQRRYLWDPVTVRAIQGYVLQRHELTEQYLITNTTLGTHRNFRSLNDAIASLGELDPIPVVQLSALDPDQSYRLRLRTHLDIESLPAPLRPVAYLSPNWRLSSKWFALSLP